MFGRRDVLRAGAALSAVGLVPGWARSAGISDGADRPFLGGSEIDLVIGAVHQMIAGRMAHAVGVNGSTPGPLIRLREGDDVTIRVTNGLTEDTSVHWHGLLVPFQFDGVPGISFPGIAPGETFAYRLPIRQAGTYWYHSHSGLQEAMGLYGPIIIDPAAPDPILSDREHIILLSDWSASHPHTIMHRLKQQPDYFNRRHQTLLGLLAGEDQSLSERLRWGRMRMDPTDISDVTGSAYRYLVNGLDTEANWTGLFEPGQRIRLRLINASAMTNFNLRIPGLRLEVVQADGQNVHPVSVDELQIAVAETYDVIVTPQAPQAYTLVAEAVDRSGLARATLAPHPGMSAPVPALRGRPTDHMKDMGMDMSAMGKGAMANMSMSMRDHANAPGVRMGPGVQSIAPMPVDRTGEPGQGLEDVGHDVLVYRDLVALDANPDTRLPSRSLEIHLTGNMERYMWSFDGEKLSQVTEPIPFRLGERVRDILVNDTMMSHPIHLHGHFFELMTGHGDHSPRKHTVNVAPGGRVTFDLTANAEGDWAFHCHMLYHMHAGMFQIVSVRPDTGAKA